MSYLTRFAWFWTKVWANATNSKPFYVVTDNGIEVRWKKLKNVENISSEDYDAATFFIEGYANPWRVDVNNLLASYQRYDPNTSDFDEQHILPVQTFKQYMNQKVLSDVFSSNPMDVKKVMLLLYGIFGFLGIIMAVLLVILVGIG